MQFADNGSKAPAPVGLILVVLIHVIAIWALASGLARDIVKKVTGPIDVKVIEERVKPPPPVEKVLPPPPKLEAPPPPFVPPPEVIIAAPTPPAQPIQSTQVAPPATPEVRPAPSPATAPAAPTSSRSAPVKAAMVCTKMGKPEMPSVDWSGEAEFRAIATVKAGRVIGVEIMPKRGGVDRKAQRAMAGAIEQTLRSTYECPGDHVFEQEFTFRLD